MDTYYEAFARRAGIAPDVGSREGLAVKKLRAVFKRQKKTEQQTIADDAFCAWAVEFWGKDWRGESTSIVQVAADPTRYLKVQPQRFGRPEIGASLQRGDDNMPTRYMTDEDFKR